MMRSMVRWTAKLSSRWVSSGLRRARLRASSARQRLDFCEEGGVDLGRAALALGGLGELVEGAFEDGLAGEDGGDLSPTARRSRVKVQ